MDKHILTVDLEQNSDSSPRIDKYIAECMPEYTRSYLQGIIKEGLVTVDDKVVKSNYRLTSGETIQLLLPLPVELSVEAENIPLDIIYEDSELLVLNKPKNMVVHPAPGHPRNTLVNALLHHCSGELSGINGVLRPGIVHRIDKDTTGAIVVCKTDKAHQEIAKQLEEHLVKRIYHAIVLGNIKEDSGTINAPIGRHPIDRKKMSTKSKSGRVAITHFTVIERFGDFTYIECQLETGRTHQIRVHLASIGHPVLGDIVYGPDKLPGKKLSLSFAGQALHAKELGFIHPKTKEYMVCDANLPEYFIELLEKLRYNTI
jgi:23S rRNA pseudouridine1911/1915/1917 synthase